MMIALLGTEGVGKTQFMLNCEKSLSKGYKGYKIDYKFSKRVEIRKDIKKQAKTTITTYENCEIKKKEGLFRRKDFTNLRWIDYRGEDLRKDDEREAIVSDILKYEDFGAFLLFFDTLRHKDSEADAENEFELLLKIHDNICCRKTGYERPTYVVLTKVDRVSGYDIDKSKMLIKVKMREHGIDCSLMQSSTILKGNPPIDTMILILEKELA